NLRNRLPMHVRHTFTEEQLTAVRETYSSFSRIQTPLVDQRITVPFPGGRLYAVMMVGKDRRTKVRMSADRTTIKRAVKARLIMALCVTLGCSGMMGLVKLRHVYSTRDYRSGLQTQGASVHPTTVPFKHDQAACETSGREWHDGECVDHQHDPTF
ncbi:MAG: hypothetical protein AAFU71_13330, partial [Cyanobacteria bacterium J06632_22]